MAKPEHTFRCSEYGFFVSSLPPEDIADSIPPHLLFQSLSDCTVTYRSGCVYLTPHEPVSNARGQHPLPQNHTTYLGFYFSNPRGVRRSNFHRCVEDCWLFDPLFLSPAWNGHYASLVADPHRGTITFFNQGKTSRLSTAWKPSEQSILCFLASLSHPVVITSLSPAEWQTWGSRQSSRTVMLPAPALSPTEQREFKRTEQQRSALGNALGNYSQALLVGEVVSVARCLT